jgi:hypothetical protein
MQCNRNLTCGWKMKMHSQGKPNCYISEPQGRFGNSTCTSFSLNPCVAFGETKTVQGEGQPWQRNTFVTSLVLEGYGKMPSGGRTCWDLATVGEWKQGGINAQRVFESLTSCLGGRGSWILGIESERLWCEPLENVK